MRRTGGSAKSPIWSLLAAGGGYVHSFTLLFGHAQRAPQAVGVLDKLNPGDYHVTIISPETYTTFTPLLPCTYMFTRWPAHFV